MTGADKITPFSFVKAISETNQNIFVDNQKEYQPFIINRALSFNLDCVFIVNEINRYWFLDKKAQHDYLLNSVSKKKRFGSKWIKKDTVAEDIELIKEAFGYSNQKAETVLSIISDKDLLQLRKKMNKGGRK